MGKTIAVVNQKGGVGKTTTSVNLTAALKEKGLRVLLCDFDPQANTTSGFGIDKRKLKYSIYNVVIDGVPAKALRIDEDGALICEFDDGIRRVLAGDVSVRGITDYV